MLWYLFFYESVKLSGLKFFLLCLNLRKVRSDRDLPLLAFLDQSNRNEIDKLWFSVILCWYKFPNFKGVFLGIFLLLRYGMFRTYYVLRYLLKVNSIFINFLNNTNLSVPVAVQYTSVSDPGCLSGIPDPDFYPSRIPDLGPPNRQQQLKGGGGIFLFYLFFVATNFTKSNFFTGTENIWANRQRIILLFTQKIVSKLSKVWVLHLVKPIPDPWYRIWWSKRHRIRIRNTAMPYTINNFFYLYF